MRSFARCAAFSAAVLIAAFLCACQNTVETPVSSEITSATASQSSSVTESVTETTAETTTETTVETTTTTTASETAASQKPTETESKLNTAKGKFNYVLKNKSWKYDGEMYYHKYKDGTVVYYDKENKSYFLIDSKGQGWYYDPDLKDFVKDE